MRVFVPPPVETRVSRRCPQCGGVAAVHGRIVRAIHDWDTTFVECLRLRCCGATFLAAPRGLTPRARYSDRVVGLVRTLAALGVPLRECARLLTRARVPATVQALRRWCADGPAPLAHAEREPIPKVAVIAIDRPAAGRAVPASAPPQPGIALPLGERAWLTIEGCDAAAVLALLEREMPPPSRNPEAGCRMVVLPRGPGRVHGSTVGP